MIGSAAAATINYKEANLYFSPRIFFTYHCSWSWVFVFQVPVHPISRTLALSLNGCLFKLHRRRQVHLLVSQKFRLNKIIWRVHNEIVKKFLLRNQTFTQTCIKRMPSIFQPRIFCGENCLRIWISRWRCGLIRVIQHSRHVTSDIYSYKYSTSTTAQDILENVKNIKKIQKPCWKLGKRV